MRRELVAAGAAAAAVAGVVLYRRRRMMPQKPDDRWLVVTVLQGGDDVDLGAGIETRLSPAPGDRGLEIAARPLADSGVSREDVRIALREAKQLAECGEAAVVEPAPHGHRRSTLPGALLDLVATRSRGKGVL